MRALLAPIICKLIMEYATTLLLPILGGLFLGLWLQNNFGVSPIWTVVLGILGMLAGLGIMYKRLTYPELYRKPDEDTSDSSKDSDKPKP